MTMPWEDFQDEGPQESGPWDDFAAKSAPSQPAPTSGPWDDFKGSSTSPVAEETKPAWTPPKRPWAARVQNPELKGILSKTPIPDTPGYFEYKMANGQTWVQKEPKTPFSKFGRDYPAQPSDEEIAQKAQRYDKGKPLGWMDRALLKADEVAAMPAGEKLKYLASLEGKGLAAFYGAPVRMARAAGTAGAKLASLAMPGDVAKDYTESVDEGWAGDKSVADIQSPALKAVLSPGSSDDPLAAAAENVGGFGGDTAGFAAGGLASKALPATYLALTKAGQGAGDAAEAGLPWYKRALYSGGEGALGAWQGHIPVGTVAEAALFNAGRRGGPLLQTLGGLTLAGGDNALYQAMSNGLARSMNVDPNREITAGLGTAAAQGIGGRLAMGNFGRGGAEEYNQPKVAFERNADGELVAYRPDYFQRNSDIKLTPTKEAEVERNFYQTKSGKLADLGAQGHALTDWAEALGIKSEAPVSGEFQDVKAQKIAQEDALTKAKEVADKAYRYFEIQDALQDHPDSPDLKRELARITIDEPTEKAIALLKMVKEENVGALRELQDFKNQGALPEDLDQQTSVDQMAMDRPWYLPRRVIQDPNVVNVPEAGPTMRMQPGQLEARTMKAAIDPVTGTRYVAHLDGDKATIFNNGEAVGNLKQVDLETPTYEGGKEQNKAWVDDNGQEYKLGQATREEIEANSKVRYGNDPMAELLNATASARAVTRGAKTIKAIQDNFMAKDWDKTKPVPEGYKIVDATMPGGRHFMGPVRKDVAEIINTHMAMKGEKGAAVDFWDRVNNTVVNVGFLNPLVHTPNQLDHFMKSQGLMKLMGSDPVTAKMVHSIQQIAHFSPEYQQYLLAGGNAMRRNRMANEERAKINQFLDDPGLGKMIEDELGQDFPGIGGRLQQSLKDLVGTMSDKAVWLPDDAMRFSIYKDGIKRGLSPRDAVKNADASFPDYRNPTNLLDEGPEGSNAKARANDLYRRVFRNEGLTAPLFMKYRFGALRSFVNAWKNLAVPEAEGGQLSREAWGKRGEALDKILAVVAMNTVVYPALSGVLNAAFGDQEEGLKYKYRAGGHTHIAEQIKDLAKGNKTPLNIANEVFIPNPLMRAGATALGFDPYSMTKIPEGGKPAAMASLVPWIREGLMVTEHGKSLGGALAPAMMAKRDRSDLEKYISSRRGMRMGQMTDDQYENYQNRVDLMRAYSEGDNEKAQALEAQMPKAQVDAARKRWSMEPSAALLDKAKSLGPRELIEAYDRAGSDEERRGIAQLLKKKKPDSFRPIDLVKAKAIYSKQGLE